ncbi:MAG: DUF2203 domain-containing protein [Candidatus Omnitrophica bacterium]|nr:DUF2203 domain-containing protein [Candidatus Omnitrophota bacterium]
MNPRVFTIDEAKTLIAKLEDLLDALVKKKQEMQKKHDQLLVLDLIAGDKIHDYESRDGKEYLDKSAELETLILSFEEDLIKFNQLGCFLRDIDRGVVDFFHVRNNELVYLCWKRGEKKIAYWHDLDSGYNERKPL